MNYVVVKKKNGTTSYGNDEVKEAIINAYTCLDLFFDTHVRMVSNFLE
jgi:hypothetical protein